MFRPFMLAPRSAYAMASATVRVSAYFFLDFAEAVGLGSLDAGRLLRLSAGVS